MNSYTKLTKNDHLILESYKLMMDGLAEFLGSGYEIVLHSFENIEHSVIKIINGYHSGRQEGSPITDLALKILGEIKESKNNAKNYVYFNRSKKGTPMRSATMPIIGENKKNIGLLCMNFYMDIPLHKFLDSIVKIENGNHDTVESFASSTDELILSAIESATAKIMSNPNVAASNKNKEIINTLYHKNIFNLKDAVLKVAEVLGISKNTVYLHIRNISNSK